MKVEILTGQTWKDQDRRRDRREGSVRIFEIMRVTEFVIECRNIATGKTHGFNRRRFGSGAVNDSFVLVSIAEGAKQ